MHSLGWKNVKNGPNAAKLHALRDLPLLAHQLSCIYGIKCPYHRLYTTGCSQVTSRHDQDPRVYISSRFPAGDCDHACLHDGNRSCNYTRKEVIEIEAAQVNDIASAANIP